MNPKDAVHKLSNDSARSKAPVFVLGCPRSGTTLLYHMLLSAGNFALYRAESNVFNVLQPRFGNLARKGKRNELLRNWLRSNLFDKTGLDADSIRRRIDEDCNCAGDFLRIVMEEVAKKQGVERWADCTPDHLLYIKEIKRQIPNALIVHIIRDGRDVALSYIKQGWSHPLPWDSGKELLVVGLFWEWIVQRGRTYGRQLGPDYYELRYEDLVQKPHETLAGLGEFVGQTLDYDQIQRAGIGSVSKPNSSFASEDFHPVHRWATKMSSEELEGFEAVAGSFLQKLGYPLASGRKHSDFRAWQLRLTYQLWFSTRHWLKTTTPLGRFTAIGRMAVHASGT